MQPSAPEGGTDALVDVGGISMADLLAADPDSPVVRSIKRLKDGLDDPEGVLSAFSSFIDDGQS